VAPRRAAAVTWRGSCARFVGAAIDPGESSQAALTIPVPTTPRYNRAVTPDATPPSTPATAPNQAPIPRTDDAPVSDRYRSNAPSEPAEIRRKLFFGAALLFALGSVYAGLLGWGRLLQYGLAGLAVFTVVAAIVSGAAAPPRRPGAGA
jgi:hypothetical protein